MTIVTVVLQSLLSLAFLFSGLSKIAGAKMQVEVFEHVKLPQWFRVVTGVLMLAGVGGLVAGFWHEGVLSLAALWIACIMLGAVLSHVRVRDSFKQLFPALLLMILLLVLFSLHVSEFKALIG
ncbi:DoxX family protein [Paenibacillus contaminans]|jgi:uncharacterized membrane protein YphA (DoxX/SURF4 family)|uniref:DoxX family protein n=1 Tax=Paenibacillus contaminans TaxID=450362 RepID=A0A329MMF1_9BACL|nr:DoxX family protein [Paenibacillus contaminans]RAV21121.1 DoxX family protein [Paenibacillus contaminans]